MLILGDFRPEKERFLGMYLDISDDWIPTRLYENIGREWGDCSASPILVIYLVPVPRCIDNVEPEADTIFDNDYGQDYWCPLNYGGGTYCGRRSEFRLSA